MLPAMLATRKIRLLSSVLAAGTLCQREEKHGSGRSQDDDRGEHLLCPCVQVTPGPDEQRPAGGQQWA